VKEIRKNINSKTVAYRQQ